MAASATGDPIKNMPMVGQEACPICTEGYTPENPAVKFRHQLPENYQEEDLTVAHLFHQGCIDRWKNAHHTCPLDRRFEVGYNPHPVQEVVQQQPVAQHPQQPDLFDQLLNNFHEAEQRQKHLLDAAAANNLAGVDQILEQVDHGLYLVFPSMAISTAIINAARHDNLVMFNHLFQRLAPDHMYELPQRGWRWREDAFVDAAKNGNSQMVDRLKLDGPISLGTRIQAIVSATFRLHFLVLPHLF